MLAQSGKPLLAAAYPVLDDGERFQGAVALGVDLRWLDFLGKTINLPENATISALNEAGKMLSHNAAMALEEGAEPGPPPSQDTIRQMIALESGTLRGDDASGSPRVYGVQQTRNGDLVVTVGQTPYLEYVRYGDALLNTLAAPVLVLLLALLAAGYASEAFVTRYVCSLARTAGQSKKVTCPRVPKFPTASTKSESLLLHSTAWPRQSSRTKSSSRTWLKN